MKARRVFLELVFWSVLVSLAVFGHEAVQLVHDMHNIGSMQP